MLEKKNVNVDIDVTFIATMGIAAWLILKMAKIVTGRE